MEEGDKVKELVTGEVKAVVEIDNKVIKKTNDILFTLKSRVLNPIVCYYYNRNA